MKSPITVPSRAPNVTIRVSGKLFEGHLPYVDQLVQSAADCGLWPMLNLERLEELDQAAVLYLRDGEDRDFGIVGCPAFVREWMEREGARKGAGGAGWGGAGASRPRDSRRDAGATGRRRVI
jgi:CxxC motif-containing protein (DUF1111 family)